MPGKLTPNLSDEQIAAWEKTYWRWTGYHSLAFGWDGPIGTESAHALFLYWEKLFFAYLPTERELEDATDLMVGVQEYFQIKWQAHYAVITDTIAEARSESNPTAKLSVEILEGAGPRNETARRIKQELAAKMAMPAPPQRDGKTGLELAKAVLKIGKETA